MLKSNWVTFSRSCDHNDALELFNLLKSYGINPREYIINDTLRGFLTESGIDWTVPCAFHNGHHVGRLADVEQFLKTATQTNEQEPVIYAS